MNTEDENRTFGVIVSLDISICLSLEATIYNFLEPLIRAKGED